MKSASRAFLAALTIGAGVSAQANITFSSVSVLGDASVVGTLGIDHFVQTGASDIDFFFNHAFVGDFRALRTSTIVIDYIADGVVAMSVDRLVLSFTNLILGNGAVHFTETVTDLINPGVIAFHNVSLFAGSGPYSADLPFLRPSKKVHVRKVIILDSLPDSPNYDLAGIGLIEQNFDCVPEPASFAALGLGIAAIAVRRRRKA